MASLKNGLRAIRARLKPNLSPDQTKEIYTELEERLLRADVGTQATTQIIATVREQAAGNPDLAAVGAAVRNTLSGLLDKLQQPAVAHATRPHVVMLVGTNGGGKTTTTAKLAHHAVAAGQQVVLAAADTFRAAATDQLQELGRRLGDQARVIAGADDPGAVAYNAVAAGQDGRAQLVIIDTAGRQPTSKKLMDQIAKIHRATGKAMPGAPHETILAIDANTGQNALRQVEAFADAQIGLNGIALTKLDGTARGGIILALAARYDIAVRFVGVGEKLADLLPFNAQEFAEALFVDDA